MTESLPVILESASILLSERFSNALTLARNTRTTTIRLPVLKARQVLSIIAKEPEQGPTG